MASPKTRYTNLQNNVGVGGFIPFTPGTSTWPTEGTGSTPIRTFMVVVGTAGNIAFTDLNGNTGQMYATQGDHNWFLQGMQTCSAMATGIVLGL